MFWLNLSILLATMGSEWCTPAAAEVMITARQNDGPLSHFDRGSSADDRSDLRELRLWLTEMRADSSTYRPNDIDKRPVARRRVTHRPKDIGGADSPEQVTSGSSNTRKSTLAKSTTTKSTAAARILFSTEEECVSANIGRDCVCDMTDFLDLIVQRLDETVNDEDETAAAGALNCHSFKSVPTAFFVYPTTAADGLDETTAATAVAFPATVSTDLVVERNGGQSGGGRFRGVGRFHGGGRFHGAGRSHGAGHFRGAGVHVEKKTAYVLDATSWKEVDFDDVVNYRLEKSSDDHYTVQYGLVGSDAKVPCVINGNKTRMNAFRWDFKKNLQKTNSMVVGTDTNILLILGLEPGDSKNYTCISTMVGESKSSSSYRHDVVAVEKAIYEIRGSVVYKTRSGCTHEVTVLVQKQLPSSMRNELCPEGSSRHACYVIVEKPKCAEDQRTMEIKYLVTLNDKANYLARIKTSKKGRIAQCYQKVLARIASVLASNLNKTLTVPIISKLSLMDTNFEPDSSQMSLKKFVSCTPGFGIREMFCAACPPHHYSPDKSITCLKCVKGFHQPVPGSEKCIKCHNIFSSGCFMEGVSPTVVCCVIGLGCLMAFSIFAISCAFCCREENEKSIRIIPRKIRKKFKKTKKYGVLSLSQTENTSDSISSAIKKKTSKLKNLLKLKKKSKSKIVDSKIKFNTVHEKFGERIENNHVTRENSTTD